MTKTGIGFTIVNVVLGIAYVLITAPVVKFRQEKQQQIDTEKKKIPGLQESITKADAERVRLLAEVNRLKANVTNELTTGANQKDELDSRIAIVTDLLNDARAKVEIWKGSLADVQTEIEARDAQSKQLQGQIASTTASNGVLTQEVADLTDQLKQTKNAVAALQETIQKDHERLITVENQRLPIPRQPGRLADVGSE